MPVGTRKWFFALPSLLCGGLAFAGTSNSCSDPYWNNTLRCKALTYLFPTPPLPAPQPVPEPPTSVGDIKAYTRVDLDDPSIRCLDGTRPIIYVDRAVGDPSNRWLISMTGGGACAARDADGNGSLEDGQDCLNGYLTDQTQGSSTASADAMSSLTDVDGSGILSADPARNPVFAHYNRIRIQKCGYDRHSGRATHPGVTATLPNGGPTFTYDLYNHGQKIVLEALDTLVGAGSGQAGLQYSTWVADGSSVMSTVETLPSIADATQVLFVGHSGAAHGLYQNIDRYGSWLRALPGFVGDVRVVHDAQFQPSVENEAAFDPSQNPDPLLHNTLFDQRTSGHTPLTGGYDSAQYHAQANSPIVRDYLAWLESAGDSLDTLLDASCVAAHAATNDIWKCHDRLHVRLHHETTPALVREDYLDPNGDHNNAPDGFLALWGEIAAHAHCNAIFGTSVCIPVFSAIEYRERLMVQAEHFRQGYFTLSELALGIDPSGPPATVFLWMPNCADHSGVYSDGQFLETSIKKYGIRTRYREFLEQFAVAPSHGVMNTQVDFLDGAQSICAPLLLLDGFEDSVTSPP